MAEVGLGFNDLKTYFQVSEKSLLHNCYSGRYSQPFNLFNKVDKTNIFSKVNS